MTESLSSHIGRERLTCRILDFTVRTSSPPCYVHPELTTHGTVKRMPSRSLWLAGNSSSKTAKRAATGGGLEFSASQRNHEWQRRVNNSLTLSVRSNADVYI